MDGDVEMNRAETVVSDLIETLEDSRRGFAEAAEQLADRGHDDLAGRMDGLSRERADLAAELRSHSNDRSEGGSAAGELHRRWMALRTALSSDGATAILETVAQGEQNAVAEYERALDSDLPPPIRSIVSRQATEVRKTLNEIRRMLAESQTS